MQTILDLAAGGRETHLQPGLRCPPSPCSSIAADVTLRLEDAACSGMWNRNCPGMADELYLEEVIKNLLQRVAKYTSSTTPVAIGGMPYRTSRRNYAD